MKPKTMKSIVFLTCFIGYSIVASAQNFQTVNSSEVKLFKSEAGNIRGYRIDSVLTDNGDSLIYPSASTRKLNADNGQCYTPFGASMLGEYIRILPDGTNLFYNASGEPIQINTRAHVNDSWVIWSSNNQTITGTVLSKELGDVFGVADSIKTIQILAPGFDFNGTTLVISKHYGLLNCFNFYAFPNGMEEYYGISPTRYSLYGIESQNLGGSNLTTFDIYDFQPGDIIQYERSIVYFGEGDLYQISKNYTSREEFLPDSIVYGFELTVIHFAHNMDDLTLISNTTTTTSQTVIANPILDALPTLPIQLPSFDGQEYGYFTMTQGPFLQKQDMSANGGGTASIINYSEIDCYLPAIDGGCLSGTNHTYYKGLGGPYFSCSQGVADHSSTELAYFLKGSTEWGTPFDLTVSVADVQIDEGITVFPNPTKAILNIHFSDLQSNLTLKMFDVTGRLVLEKKYNHVAHIQLDINREKGIYLLVIDSKAHHFSRKVVLD